MSRLGSLLVALVGFAVVNTVFAVMYFLTPSAITTVNQLSTSAVGSSVFQSLLFLLPAVQFISIHSLVLAPTSWLVIGAVWIWRGRVRSRWEGLGFDSEVFRLFMKMKGGKTRLRVLSALSKPKDRYQLAQELGVDWRAVDQHIVTLSRHGLVSNDVAYGKVRMYQLTSSGKLMLQLLENIDAEVAKVTPAV
jgi:DNA-binding transcriptional ArsR family regulator